MKTRGIQLKLSANGKLRRVPRNSVNSILKNIVKNWFKIDICYDWLGSFFDKTMEHFKSFMAMCIYGLSAQIENRQKWQIG